MTIQRRSATDQLIRCRRCHKIKISGGQSRVEGAKIDALYALMGYDGVRPRDDWGVSRSMVRFPAG